MPAPTSRSSAPILPGTWAPAPREDELYLDPYVILEQTLTDGAGATKTIKVGLIGFVPPQIMLWDRGHLEGSFAVRDILEAARAWVPEMREAGADIVVALSHSGIKPGPEEAMAENASLQLAAIDGIDAVVTGHQHLVWPGKDFEGDGVDLAAGTISGKPAVMAGFWGSHMGLIDLLLEQDGADWRVAAAETSARPIYERLEDRSIKPLVPDYQPAIDATAQIHAGDARLCPRRGRPDHGAAAILLRRRQRRSVRADRQPGTNLVRGAAPAGHGVGGHPDPLRRRSVQIRRPRRAGILYRRARRPDRHQERRRRLSLPEHLAGGGDHRRRRQGMAGALRRHLRPGDAGRGGPGPARPRLPRL